MKKRLLAVLVLLVALSGASCLVVDGSTDPAFDFNGVWSFALTGCQGQVGNITISQSGSNLLMVSNDLGWAGTCDPYSGTFAARAEGGWGYWTFQGGATGQDTLSGSYRYVEYRAGECTGSFTAQRISYREAGNPGGEPIGRLALPLP
jgi:hypothetical protein